MLWSLYISISGQAITSAFSHFNSAQTLNLWEHYTDRDGFIATLQQNIESVLCEEFDKDTGDIDVKLDELQNELLQLANSKADYEKVADQIHRLRELRQDTMAHNAERQTQRQRIAEMTEFLQGQSGILIEYDDKLVRRLVEQVTVFEDRLMVEFKSGVEVEIEI